MTAATYSIELVNGAWHVVNEQTGESPCSFSSEKEAAARAKELNMEIAKPWEAAMYGIGYSRHTSEAAARRALAKFRRDYREARHSMPYPVQVISFGGQVMDRM